MSMIETADPNQWYYHILLISRLICTCGCIRNKKKFISFEYHSEYCQNIGKVSGKAVPKKNPNADNHMYKNILLIYSIYYHLDVQQLLYSLCNQGEKKTKNWQPRWQAIKKGNEQQWNKHQKPEKYQRKKKRKHGVTFVMVVYF